MARKPGPFCPDCGADPPLTLLVWGLGKRFTCKGCGARLMVPKYTGMGFAIAGILAFWKFKDAYDSGWWKLALFGGILFIAGVVGWYAMKVRKVAPAPASSPEIPGSG